MLDIFDKPWDQSVQTITWVFRTTHSCTKLCMFFFFKRTLLCFQLNLFIATVLGGVDVYMCVCVYSTCVHVGVWTQDTFVNVCLILFRFLANVRCMSAHCMSICQNVRCPSVDWSHLPVVVVPGISGRHNDGSSWSAFAKTAS